MSAYKKVIFVCSENTSRSPMAATILANLMPDLKVESRGMVVLFPEPYNPKAVAVAAKHNLIIPNNASEEIKAKDFGNETLVLTMNSIMKQKIYDTFEEAINVYTLSEYAGFPGKEIINPYGKGMDEYNLCFEQIYELVDIIAKDLIDKEDSNSSEEVLEEDQVLDDANKEDTLKTPVINGNNKRQGKGQINNN